MSEERAYPPNGHILYYGGVELNTQSRDVLLQVIQVAMAEARILGPISGEELGKMQAALYFRLHKPAPEVAAA